LVPVYQDLEVANLEFFDMINPMTDQQKMENIEALCIEVEGRLAEYRKVLLRQLYDKQNATPNPTAEETQEILKELKEKLTSLLTEIEAKIH
jgi:hypothetical protein